MNVLVIGSGGREHTLVWKIQQSPKVQKIYCAPGNGGIAQIAECVDIKAENIPQLLEFASQQSIDLVVVGPEAPLVEGIVDAFEEKGFKIFGPSQYASQLEGSKVFAKEFMRRYHVPTSDFESFENYDEAVNFVQEADFPLVIKADGLAAGKGVMICQSRKEAQEALDDIMKKKIFKDAGNRVIIEECLIGEEASMLAISDGSGFIMLDSSQDHKRIFDEDQGPNTGGMGAYSPAPVISQRLSRQIAQTVIAPVIEGMKEEGYPFKGVLYAGLMITDKGPYVLEFNVRFGDPETQAVLPRLKNDLIDIMLASCYGSLKNTKLQWDKRACVCVVMSSRGYPGNYEKGKEITGLDEVLKEQDTMVFHAGTKQDKDKIITSGGRVLGVTSLGEGIQGAIASVYHSVEKIHFDGCFFRRDIGAKALKHTNKATV
ncbi:MAG: phosphoribosylamine--glycine ligase [Candidatus Omnitrophota bacterium]